MQENVVVFGETRFEYLRADTDLFIDQAMQMHYNLLNIPELQVLRYGSVPIDLYRISFTGTISTYTVNFKEAYNLYLNYANHIVNSSIEELKIP